MFSEIIFLIIFPAIAAILIYLSPKDNIRHGLVKCSSLAIGVVSLFCAYGTLHGNSFYFSAYSSWASILIFVLEALLSLYIVTLGIKHQRPLVVGLVLAQFIAITYLEFFSGHHLEAKYNFFIDQFSAIMALIIGIIGTLICVFAIGYMQDFKHHHEEQPDRRPFFFFLLFVFLSAMFGIVFSNNLVWLYFFWEVTTACSFLLIGYTRTEEATRNAFRAIEVNLIGGLCFVIALGILIYSTGTIEINKLLTISKAAAIIPVALLSIAGLTKSAQLPVCDWLLGAMVAPTPVSALLHSSTMVKAGVYLVLRFASVLQGTLMGSTIAMIGAVTFLFTSLIAITENNAKRLLAYSTIANLGLVILCAGIGSAQAVWAGILLIIFHALAKGLLFLCVGTVEHRKHSREIEMMEGLITSMPGLATFMLIGMAGMFLAPFGMLISKWAVLKALVDVNPLLSVIVAFGGAANLFFWVKWMGKLLLAITPPVGQEKDVSREEFVSLGILAVLTVLICALFPLISSCYIEPYLYSLYDKSVSMSNGNIIIMLIMLGLILLFPLISINFDRSTKYVAPYLGGANTDTPGTFKDSLGNNRPFAMKNYLLDEFFAEKKLYPIGVGLTWILLIIMFVLLFIK
ncbi:MAG: NADH-quinone oxidoreductase subunit L [Candidatus Omnitrophica bacterium]|nr:NADH-quinone oxidoreductase subunit L [Candidatus Omnitrophota bacterium]